MEVIWNDKKKTIIESSEDIKKTQNRKEETCLECGKDISDSRHEKRLKNKILGIIPINGSIKIYACYNCGCRWRNK